MAVYALMPFALMSVSRLPTRRFALPVVLLWSMIIVFSVLGSLFIRDGLMFFPPGSWLANLDNLSLPLGVMLLVWTLVPRNAYLPALRAAAHVIVWGSSLNGVMAAVMSLRPDIASSLGIFWSASGGASRGGVSVAENSITMGRYSGVFGQPAEAGTMYSLALVLSVWLFRRNPLMLYVTLGLISLGGVLSVSKVFLFVGVPVMALLALPLVRGWHRVGLFMGVSALTLAAVQSSFFAQWDGLDYLLRLFGGQSSSTGLDLLTAGRWSQGSFTFDLLSVVAAESFFVGAGLGGLDAPVDSQLSEVVTLAGYIGALLLSVILAVLAIALWRIPDATLRLVGVAVWLVAVGSSTGLPALTANRTATAIWLVMALMVGLSSQPPKHKPRMSHG